MIAKHLQLWTDLSFWIMLQKFRRIAVGGNLQIEHYMVTGDCIGSTNSCIIYTTVNCSTSPLGGAASKATHWPSIYLGIWAIYQSNNLPGSYQPDLRPPPINGSSSGGPRLPAWFVAWFRLTGLIYAAHSTGIIVHTTSLYIAVLANLEKFIVKSDNFMK